MAWASGGPIGRDPRTQTGTHIKRKGDERRPFFQDLLLLTTTAGGCPGIRGAVATDMRARRRRGGNRTKRKG